MIKSWEAKRKSASKISTESINKLYDEIMEGGSHCAKISGAGGGGFMMILVDILNRQNILDILSRRGGMILPCALSESGSVTWRRKNDRSARVY